MCGIAGFISLQKSGNSQEGLLNKMLETIAHRGPDARDVWTSHPYYLGQNRLSIIDLSADGTQPLENFNAIITFNGEIYNYLELKADLIAKGYQFRTKTDTEVILASYREYGNKCVERFIGMWAFVLYDRLTDTIFCSRDRFGIKPFYCFCDSTGFYFASEYKAFYPIPSFSKDINLQQVSRALQFGWLCYQDETFYSQLKSLPPAHNLSWKNGNFKTTCYWDLTTNNPSVAHLNEIDTIEGFRELVTDSVKIHMRSDVEVAICLSGGIDSSVLASTMSTQFQGLPYRSYSIYYDGKGEVDERPFINEVLNKYPLIKPDFYKPSQDEVFENLEDIIHKSDVPITGSSNISHYFLTRRIHAQGIKVVLDGQGADEYLGGYNHSWYRFLADAITKGQFGTVFTNLNKYRQYQSASPTTLLALLGKSALSALKSEQQLFDFEYHHFYPNLLNEKMDMPVSLKRVEGNKLQNFGYHLLAHTSLPTILHYVDRMTMAHSLESRVPFLDHRLVEYAHALGNNYKIREGVTKYLIREASKDILPEKIYNRKDKKGFVTPGETSWLRNQLKPLLEIDYKRLSYINKNKSQEVIVDYMKGNNANAKLVWRLAMLNYWAKLNNL